MSVILAVFNIKGGVGKTTTAIELAACFKKLGYKVLAVDLDPQADMTRAICGDPYHDGAYSVLKGKVDIMDAIQSTEEFDLLASSEELSVADTGEFGKDLDVLLLKEKLEPLENIYDFIIIDNNPSRNVLLNMTYIAADYVIIPAEADENSFKGIQTVYKDIDKYLRVNWSHAEVMGIILTKKENTGMHGYGIEQITQLAKDRNPKAFVMTTRKAIAANEVKTEGVSLQTGKKRSLLAYDYRKIADEIIRMIEEEE